MTHPQRRRSLPVNCWLAGLVAVAAIGVDDARAQAACSTSGAPLVLKQQWSIQGGVSGADIADVNGDGYLDLIATRVASSSSLYKFFGKADGQFEDPLLAGLPTHSQSMVMGDFNGDGALDLYVSVAPSDKVGFLSDIYNLVYNYFLTPFSNVADQPTAIDAGDLNGDGFFDVVTSCRADDVVSMLLGLGTGSLQQSAQHIAVGNDPRAVKLADLDADGFLDMVVVHYANALEDVLIFMGNGDGTFELPVAYETGSGPSDLVIGDLDLDGDLDIVVTNSASNTITLLLGFGDGTLATGVDLPTGLGPLPVVIDDMTRDGNPDILVGNYAGSDLSFFEGVGGGMFHPASSMYVGAFPSMIRTRDLFGDSTPEVILFADIDGPPPIFYFDTRLYEFDWRGDDVYSPNHDCASAALITPGLIEDLVVLDLEPSDFFDIDVPPFTTVSVDVAQTLGTGSVDVFLYDQSSGGESCEANLGGAAQDTSDSLLRHVELTNDAASSRSLILEIRQDVSAPLEGCNSYSIDVSFAGPSGLTIFCSGGIGSPSCPCDNNTTDPTAGCLNSTGLGARIGFSGTNEFASDDAVLTLSQARPSQTALLFQGWNSTSIPFRDGILCMGNPTARLQTLNLDALGSGQSSGSIIDMGTVPGPGVTRFYQYWYRDPSVSPCGTGSNFSSALEVVWQ